MIAKILLIWPSFGGRFLHRHWGISIELGKKVLFLCVATSTISFGLSANLGDTRWKIDAGLRCVISGGAQIVLGYRGTGSDVINVEAGGSTVDYGAGKPLFGSDGNSTLTPRAAGDMCGDAGINVLHKQAESPFGVVTIQVGLGTDIQRLVGSDLNLIQAEDFRFVAT